MDEPSPHALSSTRPVDVATVIDSAPLSVRQVVVIVLALITMALDGFDIQSASFVAPALAQEWGLSRAVLGPVLAAGLIGMAIGGVAFGALGDRRGRRPTLIFGMFVIAAGSLGSATADDVPALVAWRFVTGLGLGAPVPLISAMMSEAVPRRWRTLAVAVGLVGIPLGGLLGAAAAQELIPRYGWPSIFIVGGALPGLLAFVLMAAMPESPRWLAARGADGVRIAKLLNHLVRGARFDGGERFEVSAEQRSPGSLRTSDLLQGELRNTTLLLWLLFFSNVFVVYVFFGWLPTVLSAAGLPLTLAIQGSLLFNLGGVVGLLLTALLIGRLGTRAVVIPMSLVSVAATVLIGFSSALSGPATEAGLRWLTWTITVAGASINSVQIGIYAIATHVYVTHLRARGVGAGASIARLGGIFSTAAGSAMFAAGASSAQFFWGLAAMLCVTALALIVLRAHAPAAR